jgi:hypothetical protein
VTQAGPDDLYGLPLTEFTAARDALARELRSAGDKEEAERVKRLPKPSLAAWALDQVARSHADAVGAVLERGSGLREAQQEALTGDASGIREASRGLSQAVDKATARAAEVLRGAGREPSATQLERIRATLRAAAADPEVGELLRRGVLVADADPAGFGLGGLELAAAPSATRRRPSGAAGGADPAVDTARRELRRAQSEADAATNRARRKVERAEAAERRAAEARMEADAARQEAEEAAGEADAARRRAEEAARALSEAEKG